MIFKAQVCEGYEKLSGLGEIELRLLIPRKIFKIELFFLNELLSLIFVLALR
jgi:hypothetical protein